MDKIKILLIIIIPIISSLIGWLTNFIAIKSLFKPINKISFIGIKFQGVIPKEKNKIILNLSKIISEYLLTNKDLIININDDKQIIKLEEKFIPIFKEKINNNIPIMIKPMAEGIIENILRKESKNLIKEIILNLNIYIEENVNIEKLIYNKLKDYDINNLEKIILKIANQEFKHIEYLGALIGFIIGVFQVLLLIFLN